MTETLPDLDERTKEDLAPLCDAGKVPCYCWVCNGQSGRHLCDAPAEWYIFGTCEECGTKRSAICCQRHYREATSVAQMHCTTELFVSVVRL